MAVRDTTDETVFATSAQVIQHYARRLHQLQGEVATGAASVFALLGPIGILQREGVTQSEIDFVIQAALRGLPFPVTLFEAAA
ncbi:MAG: hypothetical protein LBV49_07510 [Azonexus sp.]|jgi:hypothetical protein|nr:hypothetical protein [Azonexus sp.]